MNSALYSVHPVCERLSPFVRRLMYCDTTVEQEIRPAPTGYAYLGRIFNGGAITAIIDGVEHRSSTGWHFSGQLQDKDVRVRFAGHVGHMLAEFTPTGFHRLMHVRGADITNDSRDVAQFAPALAERLQAMPTPSGDRDADLTRFEHLLCGLIPSARAESSMVAAVANAMEASNGRARVSDLCVEFGISPRHLARQFRDIVGVTPKYFGQVRQINYAVEMLFTNDAEAMSALAYEGGFADQSHFIRAMQRFFNQGPRRFLRSREPNLSVFLGQSRRR